MTEVTQIQISLIKSGMFIPPWTQLDSKGQQVALTQAQVERGLELRGEHGLPQDAEPSVLRDVMADGEPPVRPTELETNNPADPDDEYQFADGTGNLPCSSKA